MKWKENPLLVTKVIARSLPEVPCSPPKYCVKILSAYSPPKKKFPYAWILFFIYKVAHSLWNILFPFFSYVRVDMESPLCVAHLEIFPRIQSYLVW